MNKHLKKLVAGITSVSMLATNLAFSPIVANADDNPNYAEALQMSLYFFDAQECGDEVGENSLTWRDDCHTYDGTASLDSANGLSATEKAFIKEKNGGSNTVDVSGGYHDAGDHLKFSMTMGFACTDLAWSYYQHPDAFKNTNTESHLFEILKNMCDYFMKVTYLDDNDDVVAFCYMVGGDQDHNEWSSPEKQTMDRPTYWATASNPSADASGQMASALASSSIALRNVDPEYADLCLKYANALQKFTAKYPKANYDGVGSFYSSDSQNDDVAWSDLWCHIANGTLDSYTPITPKDGVYNGEYDHWVYTWDKLWGGYATLLSQLGYGDAFSNELKFEMDKLVNNLNQAYYPVGGGWGASRYNCAWQMYAMQYAEATGNDQYYDYAAGQMNYLLGQNPANRSYLIGYTENSPVHIHHRAANPDKSTATYTLYGALVGGPTDASGSYDDNTDSYSCTEPALDYNGCFILAISGLYDKFGANDDVTAINDVVSNASEINADYKFFDGKGDVHTPTETTTTTEEPSTDTTTETTTETSVTTEEPSTETTTEVPTETTVTTTTEEPSTETSVTTSTSTPNGEPIGKVWLLMQDGDPSSKAGVSNWESTDPAGYIEVTGNGSYSLSFDIPEGCGAEQIDFLGLRSDINVYQQNADEVEIYKDMKFEITSIVIDGTTIDYNKSANADGTNDDGATYRLSIYDTWSSRNVTDIDNKVTCASNITINFDVVGIVEDTPTPTETSTTTEEPSTETTTTTSSSEVTDKVTGDANVDGKVSTADLLVLKKHLLGVSELSEAGYTNADINFDGKVSTADLLMLKKYLLGVLAFDNEG